MPVRDEFIDSLSLQSVVWVLTWFISDGQNRYRANSLLLNDMGFIKHLSDNNQHNILHFYSTFIENIGIHFCFFMNLYLWRQWSQRKSNSSQKFTFRLDWTALTGSHTPLISGVLHVCRGMTCPTQVINGHGCSPRGQHRLGRGKLSNVNLQSILSEKIF